MIAYFAKAGIIAATAAGALAVAGAAVSGIILYTGKHKQKHETAERRQ